MTKHKWGVMIGRATKAHPDQCRPSLMAAIEKDLVGRWKEITSIHELRKLKLPLGAPKLFDTREEARQYAKECAAKNPFWKFHPKIHHNESTIKLTD